MSEIVGNWGFLVFLVGGFVCFGVGLGFGVVFGVFGCQDLGGLRVVSAGAQVCEVGWAV